MANKMPLKGEGGRLRVVDGHCHLDAAGEEPAVSELLSEMDALGVDRAVICPTEMYIAVYNREGNDYIIEAVRGHPQRFIGLATVNPWYGYKAIEELERSIKSGLKGLKLHPFLQGFHLTHEVARPIVEACAALGIPVYVHTGTPISSMPFQLAELARGFPEVPFIMGHMGHSDFWRDTIPAASRSDNIYLETSLVAVGLIRDAFEKLGAGRLIFGSDVPHSNLACELEKMSAIEMSGEEQRKVFGENLLSLLDRG